MESRRNTKYPEETYANTEPQTEGTEPEAELKPKSLEIWDDSADHSILYQDLAQDK